MSDEIRQGLVPPCRFTLPLTFDRRCLHLLGQADNAERLRNEVGIRHTTTAVHFPKVVEKMLQADGNFPKAWMNLDWLRLG